MSRIGNKPIPMVDGVKVNVASGVVNVEGPKGKLSYELRPEVNVDIDEEAKELKVDRRDDDKHSRAFHGLTRALINNMIFGVKNGYEKKLELQGVGYVCNISGNALVAASRIGKRIEETDSRRPGCHLPRPNSH